MTRFLNNIRFLWKDKLVKYSVTWLMAIMVISVIAILSLQLNIEIWPYLPYPSEGLRTVFLSLAYSYIVSYVFFALTILFPRVIKMLDWYGLTLNRFRLFYEAWATIYLIFHFAFKIGNNFVVEDLMVHLKVKEIDINALYYSNRIDLALNLQNALNSMDVFSQLVNNHMETLPSDLDLLLQETNYNPVRSSVNTVIEILNNDGVEENNVYNYVVKAVLNLEIQFANLNRLSNMLGFQTILKNCITKTAIFHDTRHLIKWVK